MKKATLIMIASASMLLATPAIVTDNTQQRQGMKQMKQKNNCSKKKCSKKKNMRNKSGQKKINSPFLIKHGLPHMNKMVMKYLDNPDFNLTSEQKFQLAKVRKSTMSAIMEVKPKVGALRKEIIIGSQTGVSLDKLKVKLAELAILESTATLIHLQCIEATKSILSKDQLFFLLVNKNKHSKYEKPNKRERCKKKY